MMHYKNTKAMVHSSDGDIDFFDIVNGVFARRYTKTTFLFITCLDCIQWMSIDLMKENSLTLKKARSRWNPAETIIDADYTNDLLLLVNTPAQAEYQLHNLEHTARGICPFMKSDKTVFLYFKQDGTIFTLSKKPLKYFEHFSKIYK